ncbi:type VII secretion system-associated protein [Streptomyces sp. NPDC004111]|uniref:type VII secretion system-associated protein n=1 Tax=Streptomyces sp. NPDC004111 TaxID=3364690 RepID=UPI00367D83D8
MAPDPTDLSHLDTDTLTKFVNTDVQGFLTLIGALKKDTDGHAVAAMQYLATQFGSTSVGYVSSVLKLGRLGATGDKATGPLSAAPFLAYLAKSAKELSAVEDNQEKLFTDIRDGLNTVLTDMKKQQQKSLEDIESQKFLNDLRNVDGDLAPSQKS